MKMNEQYYKAEINHLRFLLDFTEKERFEFERIAFRQRSEIMEMKGKLSYAKGVKEGIVEGIRRLKKIPTLTLDGTLIEVDAVNFAEKIARALDKVIEE